MKNTTKIGNIAQAAIMSALMKRFDQVCLPIGEGGPYDLVVDIDGVLKKVQCKTGKLISNGSIRFKNFTVLRSGESRKYGTTVDYYGVFCPQNNKCYLIPSDDCAGSFTYLRVSESKRSRNSRMAEKYELQA